MNVIRKEGVFRLFDRHATLILTDEKQLERIAYHPELPLFDDEDLGFSNEKQRRNPKGTTLESFVKAARERGCERIEVSYDFFFGGTTRQNYPDSPVTVAAFKQIHDCAEKYGMSFGASLISPLDLGGGYAKTHDNTGFQWHFQEGAIARGDYEVTMRRQIQWYNNKGPIQLELHRVLAVAFNEERIDGTSLFFVDENEIEDISDTAKYELVPDTYVLTDQGYAYDQIVVRGHTKLNHERVLVVLEYRTPEIDYFDRIALPYIKGVIDLHNENGIDYAGFYSDEMHIQFDWDLFNHFGETEITTRYVTPALVETYAGLYGKKFDHFLKYMVYFAYGQHRFLPGDAGKEGAQHVWGKDADAAYETWLFRKRYFELVSGKVVSLAIDSRAYAESLFGGPIMCRAHATWQESPTCDHFAEDVGFQLYGGDPSVTRYDYDKPYVWGVSIRENISACCDYFRWNEFLSGAGTDHAEGGYTDRNYYAQSLAASFGSLNKFEKAYCAGWGSPKEVLRRFRDVGVTYGASDLEHAFIQNMQHRESDALLLHPTELNFSEERFGTWMVQYGYGNYITEEMLLKYGRADDEGHLVVNGRPYRALVALFELFAFPETFDMLEKFVKGGGRLVWTAAPCLKYEDGSDCAARFHALFGLANVVTPDRPLKIRDRKVTFEGALDGIAPMTALTDFLPDYAYPVEVKDAEVVARTDGVALGAYAKRGKGVCLYLGFRPRDDQSCSKGEDVTTLFDVLCRVGAYAEGSLEARSRRTAARYITNRFPNGAVSLANHYRTFHEDWPGLFYRDEAEDKKALEGRALPPVDITLAGVEIDGHKISFQGTDALTFRVENGRLVGYAGKNARGIEADGVSYTFADENVDLAFAQLDKSRFVPELSDVLMVKCEQAAKLTIPAAFAPAKAAACKIDFFEADIPVAFAYADGAVTLDVTEETRGKWIALAR